MRYIIQAKGPTFPWSRSGNLHLKESFATPEEADYVMRGPNRSTAPLKYRVWDTEKGEPVS